MKKAIKNGKLILKDRVLEGYDLILKEGKIQSVCPSEESKTEDGCIYDVKGSYVMPGIVDIHSDMIESYIQPRSTAVMDFEMGLKEAEKVLVGCGITTMFHSISMFREGTWDVKAIRQAPQVKRLAELVARYRHEERLIRHRYHLRYEIDNLACYEQVKEMIQKGYVDLLSFMDHTPGQGQYKNLDIYRKLTDCHTKSFINLKFFQRVIIMACNRDTAFFCHLRQFFQLIKGTGFFLKLGFDKRCKLLFCHISAFIWLMFPITMEVAKAAKLKGFKTVVGALNILLGGSHSGNLSALEAIREGAADVLVSDYYPQSLLQAVFQLYETEGIPVWEAVGYVTLAPAEAVGLADCIGSLEEGKEADILVVKSQGGRPCLEKVFVAGECIMECHYRKAD